MSRDYEHKPPAKTPRLDTAPPRPVQRRADDAPRSATDLSVGRGAPSSGVFGDDLLSSLGGLDLSAPASGGLEAPVQRRQAPVQMLVSQRDQQALATWHRLMGDAVPAEARLMRAELDRALRGASMMNIRVDLDFLMRGEQYRLQLPIEAARQLQQGGSGAAAAETETESPRPARRRAPRREGASDERGGGRAEGEREAASGGTTVGNQSVFDLGEVELGTFRQSLATISTKLKGSIDVEFLSGGGGGGDGGGAEPTGPQVTVGASGSTQGNRGVQAAVKQSVLDRIGGYQPSVGGGVALSRDSSSLNVAGALETQDRNVVIRGVQLQFNLASWSRERPSEIQILTSSLTFDFNMPPFETRLPDGRGVKLTPHMQLEFTVEPNWRAIGQRLVQRFGTQAAVAGAETAAGVTAAETGAATLGAGALGAALAGIAVGAISAWAAVQELQLADRLPEEADAATHALYYYCMGYTLAFFDQPAIYSNSAARSGAAAADRDRRRVAIQGNVTVDAVREAALEMGAESLYESVFERAMPRYRDLTARHLGNPTRTAPLVEGQLMRAQWGGSVFNRLGAPRGGRGGNRRPVQRKAASDAIPASQVHQAAAHGLSGSGGQLPHAAAIQQSFGHHDISSVSAHVGGRAAEGAAAMGASAYATGNDIAFASSPDLHTAAHEAAHIVQQRSGVDLPGDVSSAGDRYEQHADQVADAVVRGESAAGLLDQMGGGSGGQSVQRRVVQRRTGECGDQAEQARVEQREQSSLATRWYTLDPAALDSDEHREALEALRQEIQTRLASVDESTVSERANGTLQTRSAATPQVRQHNNWMRAQSGNDAISGVFEQARYRRFRPMLDAMLELLKHEGGSAGINTYDNQWVTLGGGFSMRSGQAQSMLGRLPPEMQQRIRAIGMGAAGLRSHDVVG